MLRKFLFILPFAALVAVPQFSEGQNWRHYRSELFFGVGAGNFLGEVGGANKQGRNFIQDLEIAMTRPAVTVGHRWRLSEVFSWKNVFCYGRLNGDDALTKEPYRQNRNMHFRTGLLELSTQLEYYFIKEQLGHIYRTKAVKGKNVRLLAAYLFGGAGGIHFNPKAKYPTDGKWYELKPLNTEGQGLVDPSGKVSPPNSYSLFSIVIPYGIGIKYNMNTNWNIGIELGNRKTFTDYMDDVSTVYYDNNAIQSSSPNGTVAAYFADPSLDPNFGPGAVDGVYVTTHGQQRGDPKDNDSYAFLFLSINYKFLKSRYNLPKF